MLEAQSTVLVVDDEPSDLERTAVTLSSEGYRVITATNGRDAVRAHARYEGQIDLLITGVAMAPITGFELTDLLRTAQANLRVLYLSGYGAEMQARFLHRRNISILRKPFTSHELLEQVSEALGAVSHRLQLVGG